MAVLAVSAMLVASAKAQSTDNAGNYGTISSSTFTNGSNEGTGYNPWQFSNTGTTSENGEILADSTLNAGGGHLGINSGNSAAWGLYANNSQTASAVRPFSSALQIGQTVSIDFENGYIQTGGTVGLGLQDAGSTNRIEFFFVGGNSSYTLQTATGANTGIGFTNTGLQVSFTLASADTMNVSVTGLNGNSASYSTNGIALEGTPGSAIDQIRLFNFNAGSGTAYNDFYNNLTISAVPEPSSLALVGLGMLGVLSLRRSRNRRK